MGLSELPSVDRLLSSDMGNRLVVRYGRQQVAGSVRSLLDEIRSAFKARGDDIPGADDILAAAARRLSAASRPLLRPVINLTGTVLHTNLGRAPLPNEAVELMARIATEPSNLEFDLAAGKRGDRDTHIENLIVEITGAEAATVVNNNAAAVLLVLNTLALGKEVPVSRGELVEIGGSFRIPEIMSRSGCQLIETGATNRTHLADYEKVIGNDTALLMKVHTSNYEIRGFTTSVSERALAELAHARGLPLVTDLGSGTLIDLTRYGLPAEPTVQDTLRQGSDLITFSGDKLLGGPQAGIIVGKRDLIDALKANPIKRALRADKITIAALFEVLKLYRDPDSLPRRLPALRLLTRSPEDILITAKLLLPEFVRCLGAIATVSINAAQSQVGSGSLPLDTLPGYAIIITPFTPGDKTLQQIALAFRRLPIPVIGRIHDGRLLFDLRALEAPGPLIHQLPQLSIE